MIGFLKEPFLGETIGSLFGEDLDFVVIITLDGLVFLVSLSIGDSSLSADDDAFD